MKLISILGRKNKFPSRTRNKLTELVGVLLDDLENDVHAMLCDCKSGDDYRGLDREQDTAAEVETAIRFFPNVLSRTVGCWNRYPIHYLYLASDGHGNNTCNLKAASFVPVLAGLGNELNQFEEKDRGGLLAKDGEGSNSLKVLVSSSRSSSPRYGEEHNRCVDNVFLSQLIHLRQIGLFKKEDILSEELLHYLCCEDYFAENRFRFLIEWDPSSLIAFDSDGWISIHYAAQYSSIQGFHTVFEYGLRYYSNKKGINRLFQKAQHKGKTPFQLACTRFGWKTVVGVVKEILHHNFQQQQQQLRVDDDNKPNSNNIGESTMLPYNITEALISAAVDETIHFDCVFFLLRRHPDILMQILNYLNRRSGPIRRNKKRKMHPS